MKVYKSEIILGAMIVVILMTAAPVCYFFHAERAAALALRLFLSPHVQFHDIKVGHVQKDFVNGTAFKDVRIIESPELAKGSVLKISQVQYPSVWPFSKNWLSFGFSGVRWKSAWTGDVTAREVQGRPMKGLTFYDLESRSVPGLPEGSLLHIGKLHTRFSLDLESFQRAEQGSLDLPNSDPLTFTAVNVQESLVVGAFCHNLSMKDILKIFYPAKANDKIFGGFEDVGLWVKSSIRKPEWIGEMRFKKFRYNDYTVLDGVLSFRIVPAIVNNKMQFQGEITLKQGTLMHGMTVIKIETSHILLQGDLTQTIFDLNGVSNVEGTRILVTLKGQKLSDLKVSSDARISQKRLLMMLVIGKSWQNLMIMPMIHINAS